MELFEWSSRYSVWVDSIDEDHKGLFELINTLYSSLTIVILSFLRHRLIQHIQGIDMDYVPYLKAKNLS